MPKSIAIIGASNNKAKFGGRFLANLLEFGYKGELLPVNPKEAHIQGLPASADMDAIAREVDLAVITTPGQFVLEQVKACARERCKRNTNTFFRVQGSRQ